MVLASLFVKYFRLYFTCIMIQTKKSDFHQETTEQRKKDYSKQTRQVCLFPPFLSLHRGTNELIHIDF